MELQCEKPTIPISEYLKRWEKVQTMMVEKNLDFLIAYADDRATFGPAHARWLANFPVHFEPCCVLFPRQGAPIMLVGPESDEYALLSGQISDVKVLQEFTHPDEDYPFSIIKSLSEIMIESGWKLSAIKRIGLGGRGLIAADLMTAFQIALPGVEWINSEGDLCYLRAQKSPAEIEIIRHAYKIAEVGFQAAIEAIEVGVSERAVAAEIDGAMRRAGSEGTGIDTMVASGPNTRPILARSTFRQIEQDSLVLLTIAPRYEGYHSAIGRVVLTGNPPQEIKQALDLAIEAQKACARALRPGIEGREIDSIGRKFFEEQGLEKHFLYSGVHSVGVIEFEPPIFGPSSTAILKENMIISIDIPMFNTPWGGLRVENGYLITKDGAEPLHHTPYQIKK
jgi:Xaa-Pro aminopeptidase